MCMNISGFMPTRESACYSLAALPVSPLEEDRESGATARAREWDSNLCRRDRVHKRIGVSRYTGGSRTRAHDLSRAAKLTRPDKKRIAEWEAGLPETSRTHLRLAAERIAAAKQKRARCHSRHRKRAEYSRGRHHTYCRTDPSWRGRCSAHEFCSGRARDGGDTRPRSPRTAGRTSRAWRYRQTCFREAAYLRSPN